MFKLRLLKGNVLRIQFYHDGTKLINFFDDEIVFQFATFVQPFSLSEVTNLAINTNNRRQHLCNIPY